MRRERILVPDYERLKYCGYHTKRGYCRGIAQYECACGKHHWDEYRNSMGGVISGTARPDYTPEEAEDHPLFVCSKHEDGRG